MAEITALANLAGVICCGLKLSISLYDFATSLGAAGREIKTLGTDITLFCSVLKQVQSALGQEVNSFHISPNAVQTTQEIIDQSSRIFDELFAIFAKLQKDEKLPIDFVTRVRWTFKRAKVLLLRESLQSCTAMLHLMLTTMSFAQRIATKGTAFDDEDEEEHALTHSLCLAHRTTNERLEELEKLCLVEESQRSDSALTMLASQQEEYRIYSPEDHAAEEGPEPTKRDSGRSSSLLGSILALRQSPGDRNSIFSEPARQRESILESDMLLRSWTDQCDPLAWSDNEGDAESIKPWDSVSRYHGHCNRESVIHPKSTFFESATSTTVSMVDEGPFLTAFRSREEAAAAADRSRRKVAKLTGEDFVSTSPDWMWRMVLPQTASQTPLPPLELPSVIPERRKKTRPPRWPNNRNSYTEKELARRSIEERLRYHGILT